MQQKGRIFLSRQSSFFSEETNQTVKEADRMTRSKPAGPQKHGLIFAGILNGRNANLSCVSYVTIGHFQTTFSLLLKASLGVHTFI